MTIRKKHEDLIISICSGTYGSFKLKLAKDIFSIALTVLKENEKDKNKVAVLRSYADIYSLAISGLYQLGYHPYEILSLLSHGGQIPTNCNYSDYLEDKTITPLKLLVYFANTAFYQARELMGNVESTIWSFTKSLKEI